MEVTVLIKYIEEIVIVLVLFSVVVYFVLGFFIIYLLFYVNKLVNYYINKRKDKEKEEDRIKEINDLNVLSKIDIITKEIQEVTYEILNMSLGNTKNNIQLKRHLESKVKERQEKQQQLYKLLKQRKKYNDK